MVFKRQMFFSTVAVPRAPQILQDMKSQTQRIRYLYKKEKQLVFCVICRAADMRLSYPTSSS